MANSVIHYIGTDSKYTWDNALGNANVSSTNYNRALIARNYYAYTDAYTTNSNGSNQGKKTGYQVKIIVKCSQPNKTTRRVTLGCAVYFCRLDGYASNNKLTVKIAGTRSKQSITYSKQFSTSSKWKKTAGLTVQLNYPSNSGSLTETFTITGYNETGSCRSIENATVTVQLPDIGAAYKAAGLSLPSRDNTIGKEVKIGITGRDPSLLVTLGLEYTGDDNIKREVYPILDKKLDSYNYTIPYSILSNIRKKKKAACTWTLSTWTATPQGLRGDTRIGYKTITGNLIVPENDNNVGFKVNTFYVKDTTGGGQEYTNPSGSATLTGYESGVSRPMLRLTFDDSKAYGATISSIAYTIATAYRKYDNVSLPGNKQHSFTAPSPINGNGTYTVSAVITDSRGISFTKSTKLSFAETSYPPDITSLSVSRGTSSDGTVGQFVPNDEGDKVRVWFQAESTKIASDGTGTMKAVIKYKEVGANSYTQYSRYNFTGSNGVSEIEQDVLITGLDAEKNYVIRVEVTDSSTRYRETNLSSALYFIELSASGRGLSIGEVAETNQTDLRIGIPVKFNNNVLNKQGGTQFTSDEKKKNNILPLIDTLGEEGLLKIYASIDPISYRYNDEKHKNSLTHFGFSANKLKDVLTQIGLNTDEYSIIQSYDETITDPNNPKNKYIENFLSMSYEELTPINFLAIKLILKELININNRLKEIESNGKDSRNE